MINDIFRTDIILKNNLIEIPEIEEPDSMRQSQTKAVFTNKWAEYDRIKDKEASEKQGKERYLNLYGFETEEELAIFLKDKEFILDAGSGAGYKTAWLAELSPDSLVLGMDLSDTVYRAAERYGHLSNLIFIKGDISNTQIKDNTIDFISCDQVIHHTDNPSDTFRELSRILSFGSEFACYVYRKKALPRELLDSYFRNQCMELTHEELMALSTQLTELGKTLTELEITLEIPEMPALGIKGGEYDLQRFIYWNFLKCFWNKEVGFESSILCNYDWYSPSNAMTFKKEEFLKMAFENALGLKYFHEEEACYSARFAK